ncbi:hypothetical protein [Streptomyces sp. NPDC055210]
MPERTYTLHPLPSAAAFPYGFQEGPDSQLSALDVDPARQDAPTQYEGLEPAAEKYRHVCGPIPVDAVVATEPWR